MLLVYAYDEYFRSYCYEADIWNSILRLYDMYLSIKENDTKIEQLDAKKLKLEISEALQYIGGKISDIAYDLQRSVNSSKVWMHCWSEMNSIRRKLQKSDFSINLEPA